MYVFNRPDFKYTCFLPSNRCSHHFIHEARTWQNSNMLSQRERKRFECRNKGSRGRRIETHSRAGKGGREETRSGGWDKLKELSKLSTSTAGRLSPTPTTISLSPHSATHVHVYTFVYVCYVPCTILCENVHISEYVTVCVRTIYISTYRRGLSYHILVQTHSRQACSLRIRLFIYLFIYSEQLECARHFMNTILDAFAPIFPKIRKNLS